MHPAKSEVRFREQRLVHDFLFRTLHEALAQTRAGAVTSQPVAPLPGSRSQDAAPLSMGAPASVCPHKTYGYTDPGTGSTGQ